MFVSEIFAECSTLSESLSWWKYCITRNIGRHLNLADWWFFKQTANFSAIYISCYTVLNVHNKIVMVIVIIVVSMRVCFASYIDQIEDGSLSKVP